MSDRYNSPHRRALVTGASAGIGREFALQLAARGFALILVARSVASLEELAERLHQEHGSDVELIAADLTEPEGRRHICARLEDVWDPVDLLVNAAGMGYGTATTSNTMKQERYLQELNGTSKIELTLSALASMANRRGGSIINVSSVAALGPVWVNSIYGASQAYLLAATEALAYSQHVKRSGVQIMALCPGDTRTDFNRRAGIPDSTTPTWRWLTPEFLVRQALRDLDAGKIVSIPSVRYKILAWAVRHLPHRLTARQALDFGTLIAP